MWNVSTDFIFLVNHYFTDMDILLGKKNYVLGQIITVLKNPILTLTHKTAHCTYGQACNPRTQILSHLANLS